MIWHILDENRTDIYITDLWREWIVPKFRYTTEIAEPYLTISWTDTEMGNPKPRSLKIDYRDVSGYGYANPSSASDLNDILTSYKYSSWTDIGPGGDLLTAKADLLSHNGTTDEILPGGANEYYLKRDNSTSTGLKWVAASDILSAANVGSAINSSGAATPNDTDVVATADTSILKKITWTNIKTFLKTYFDTTYLPIASPTATGTLTSPAIIVSSETASRVAIIDTSKNIKSADTATYPSLTELAYVKGVTSSIQTQFAGKQALGVFSKSASDQTTTSVSLVNITNVGISIAANQNIYFKAQIKLGCSATNGARFAVTLPTGATMLAWHSATGSATVAFAASQWLTTSGTEGATVGALINSNMVCVIEGWVYNGANTGTIQIQGRSVNAANTVTFYSGSMIKGTILP